jgi:hypothetical protein
MVARHLCLLLLVLVVHGKSKQSNLPKLIITCLCNTDHNQSALFEYLNSQIEWENAQLGIHSGDEQINICLGL